MYPCLSNYKTIPIHLPYNFILDVCSSLWYTLYRVPWDIHYTGFHEIYTIQGFMRYTLYRVPWDIHYTGVHEIYTIQGFMRYTLYRGSWDIHYTGFPTKDETLDSTVRILYCPFPYIHKTLNLSIYAKSLNKSFKDCIQGKDFKYASPL